MAHLDHFNMELGDSKMKRGGVRIVEGAVVHIGSAGHQELHSFHLDKDGKGSFNEMNEKNEIMTTNQQNKLQDLLRE